MVVCCRNRGSGCSRLGYGISPLVEVIINPTIELPELTQDWEIDFWWAQQNLVHQDPGERSSAPTETVLDLPMGIQESLVEAWVPGGLLQVGALSVAVHTWDLLKEVAIIFMTSTIV